MQIAVDPREGLAARFHRSGFPPGISHFSHKIFTVTLFLIAPPYGSLRLRTIAASQIHFRSFGSLQSLERFTA